MTLLAAFVVLVFLYGLVSGALERTILTAPILFKAAGALAHAAFPALPQGKGELDIFVAGRGDRPRDAALHGCQPHRPRGIEQHP